MLLIEDEVPFLGDVVPGGAVVEEVAAQSPQDGQPGLVWLGGFLTLQ